MTAGPHHVRQDCRHTDAQIREHGANHALVGGERDDVPAHAGHQIHLRSGFKLLDRHDWLFTNHPPGAPRET